MCGGGGGGGGGGGAGQEPATEHNKQTRDLEQESSLLMSGDKADMLHTWLWRHREKPAACRRGCNDVITASAAAAAASTLLPAVWV
ncbi:uncharacterized [Tachysurus ichikawai]